MRDYRRLVVMCELLHRCMTKATTAEGDDIRRSVNWVFSRRGFLKVYTDRIECGDWTIPYDQIDEAVLFRTSSMFIPCYLLRVKAQGQIYQFGLNPGRYWSRELPFPVVRENKRLGWSWYSVAVRIVALAVLAYLLWSSR
jgi:hypothetical protein